MGSFSTLTFAAKDNYEAGVIVSVNSPNAICENGTNTYSFVLNCSKHYDPETNYTITGMTQDACSTTFYINTVAGGPTTTERKAVTVPARKTTWVTFMLIGFGVLGGVIALCSCCLACCLACKNRREKCANGAKHSWCSKRRAAQQQPAPAPQPRPAPQAAPRPQQQPAQVAPRPPVTPPPAAAPQIPQMPGYFVPVPQGMAPMYPNLYQGGYLPLVPMMPQQPAVHTPANPFVMLDNEPQHRENQIVEDERLARLLQNQFNHESA